MRKVVEILSALAMAMGYFAPDAAFAGTTVLKPVTNWYVEWTPTTCSLKRGFGDKQQMHVLVLEQFAPGDTFQLTVIGKELGRLQQEAPIEIQYGNGEKFRIRTPLLGRTTERERSLFISTTSLARLDDDPDSRHAPVTVQQEAAATSIKLHWSGRILTFETGPLDKAFNELRKCTSDLVKTWNLDPAQQASLADRPRPRTSPNTWLRSSDYPRSMAMMGKQALVNFRLLVDAAGKPTGCQVQRSYNDKQFDEITCRRLMERATFEPARDTAGNAVSSYYANTVVWASKPS